MGLRWFAGAPILPAMQQLSLEIDEAANLVLTRLANQWGTTPGRVVGLLCQSVDHRLIAEITLKLIDQPAAESEPGVARMPGRGQRPRLN
jgi:hypothetical protein